MARRPSARPSKRRLKTSSAADSTNHDFLGLFCAIFFIVPLLLVRNAFVCHKMLGSNRILADDVLALVPNRRLEIAKLYEKRVRKSLATAFRVLVLLLLEQTIFYSKKTRPIQTRSDLCSVQVVDSCKMFLRGCRDAF